MEEVLQMKIFSFLGILLISIVLMAALATADESVEEGKKLVESKINCNELNDEQLNAIGDYYIEQMHPGESHELMDKMMGGEGSITLKQMHTNMAKRLYCNENIQGYGMMSSGMMMPMMQMMGGGMMGGNMMNMMGSNGGVRGYSNMMGYPTSYGFGYWYILWYVFWITVIVLVIWLVYKYAMQKDDDALSIIQKRYAKGEISKKEYEDMK